MRSIVKAAKEDGVTVQTGFDVVGQLKECMEISNELKGEWTAKLSSVIPIFNDSPTIEDVEGNSLLRHRRGWSSFTPSLGSG